MESGSEQEPSPKSLEYGRDLTVQLFQDDSPLVNLGYSTKQKDAVRRALRTLEEPGKFYQQPQPYVEFGQRPKDEGDDAPQAWLTELQHGGYKVKTSIRPTFTDLGYVSNFVVTFPPEADIEVVVGVFEMLPAQTDVNDINGLVKHLYEGAFVNRFGSRQGPGMQRPSLFSTLRSKLSSSVSTFKAGWVDESTKLELVVETDAYSRLFGRKFGSKVQETWRKLPEIELEGQSWIPFGKKPNPSREVISRVLKGVKETKMSLRNLAPGQN